MNIFTFWTDKNQKKLIEQEEKDKKSNQDFMEGKKNSFSCVNSFFHPTIEDLMRDKLLLLEKRINDLEVFARRNK